MITYVKKRIKWNPLENYKSSFTKKPLHLSKEESSGNLTDRFKQAKK